MFKCLRSVLKNNSIESEKITKQYLFYSQNLNKFEDLLLEKFPDLSKAKIDKESNIYVGDIIIAITSRDRQPTDKLGIIAFDIVEELARQTNIDRKSISKIVDSVICKFRMIDNVQRAAIKRVHNMCLRLRDLSQINRYR